MPRSISGALQTHLQSGATTLSTLVLVTRTDGTNLGFTDCTSPITFGGVTYHPEDSVRLSAIHQTADTAVDNMDLNGLLRSDRISDTDVEAGIYNGAAIVVSLVNRNDLTMGQLILLSGFLGQMTTESIGLVIEGRSKTQLLKQRIGRISQYGCRVERLGNALCKLNMAGNTVGGVAIRTSANVSYLGATTNIIGFASTAPSGTYDYGRVTFTTGPNNLITRDIKSHVDAAGVAQITLRDVFPYTVSVGDTATWEVGCDRQAATCQAKFNNYLNYHGEPNLPGNNQVSVVGR